jgi:K+-transporting ATPase KdpF subunit
VHFCTDPNCYEMNPDNFMEVITNFGMDISAGYIIGAIIAFCILGYLVFTLIRPEKF